MRQMHYFLGISSPYGRSIESERGALMGLSMPPERVVHDA